MSLGKTEYLSVIGIVGIRICTEKSILLASDVQLLTLNTEHITFRWECLWSSNTITGPNCNFKKNK